MADKKWMQAAVPAKNKGKFTAKAKAHGESVAEYANDVLKKGSKASSTTKHEAQFAKNARKIAKSHKTKGPKPY